MIITLFFLLIPIGAFVLFWLYALKRNWRSIRLLAFTVGLALWLLTLILWVTTGVSEKWLLGVGTVCSVLVGLVVLSLPITAPEVVSRLGFGGDTSSENGEPILKKPVQTQRLLASILIFGYIVIGYWVIVYFLDPNTFILDLPNQWWIIPFALFVAVVRYIFSRLETIKTKKTDHE
ncbi:MAG TPA: hypothetical protein PKM01_06175 [Anaerolineaceae bacterium]|nr:hypothetical protein [Anaerolineaceae bacterium]HQF62046.1 hypothetical protein [Anaerolineaceae bacterium]HQH85278.1 hypothetical protein [Anaerolineaceae bacterium]